MGELIALFAMELRRLWRGGCLALLVAALLLTAIAYAQQPAALLRQGVWLDLTAWAGVSTLIAALVPTLWLFSASPQRVRSLRPSLQRWAAWLGMVCSTAAITVLGGAMLGALHGWGPDVLFTSDRITGISGMAAVCVAILGLSASTAGAAVAIAPALRARSAWIPLAIAGVHAFAVGVPSEILGATAAGGRPWQSAAFGFGIAISATALFPARSNSGGRSVRLGAVHRS